MEERYVDQFLSRPVETVTPDTPLAEAAATLIEHDIGAVVVVNDMGQFVGLLTATDFVALAREEAPAAEATVAEWMRTDVITTTRQTPISDVADTMIEHLIHHVPVVDGDEVVGIITTLDLTASLR
ncbi:CBS domain-containing protein [Halobellus inordinatus]|uniref:CBS domain-containing protein n=1 Tax=Halobellus inordinatus TaxID=1126236 RepID=UPI00210A3D75|nr:CBS domain-containing protein [Halobellus inordinatus]